MGRFRCDQSHARFLAGLSLCVLLANPCAAAPPAGSAPASAANASSPATSPGADQLGWVDEALQPVERICGQLDGMRIKKSSAQAVWALVKEATDQLDEIDRLAAEESKRPSSLPATLPARAKEQLERFRTMVNVRRCQLQIVRGQVHQYAASALPDTSADRAKFLQAAIDIFSSLRIDYVDCPLAMMGYIGEARCQRLAGKNDQSLAVLEAILRPQTAPDKTLADVRRLACLERFESLLAGGDLQVFWTESAQWRNLPEIKNEAAWLTRLDWILARAQLASIAQAASKAAPGTIEKCAQSLRNPKIVAVAPAYERLCALVRLEELAGQKLLTQVELLEWGNLLTSAGDDRAAAAFARLVAADSKAADAQVLLTYAALTFDNGEALAAAELSERALSQMKQDDPRHAQAQRLRAASLLKARQGSTQPAPQVEARLKEALTSMIGSDEFDLAIRRDALVQWVDVSSADAAPGEMMKMLSGRPELVEGCAYLTYWQASLKWSDLSAATASAPASSLATSRPAGAILDLLTAAESAKDCTGALRAHIALLRAKVLAGPPTSDLRAAVALLRERQNVLDAVPAVGREAAMLNVQLLLDLGLVDEAIRGLEKQPDAGGVQASVPLRLAEALAERYLSAGPAGRDRLREQVIKFATQAMSQSIGDTASRCPLTGRCAIAMIKADAGNDALNILTQPLSEPKVQADKAAFLDLSLLKVRALVQLSRNGQALSALDELEKAYPSSARVFFIRGQCHRSLSQPSQAIDAFRKARKLSRPGSPAWCEATLCLVSAMDTAGSAADAKDVLRVAQALYPDFGNGELLRRAREAARSLADKHGANDKFRSTNDE